VANTFSNPLMPHVPNFFAPWTYDEILITVPAHQHTPVTRPKSLLTGKDVKVEWTANWGPSGGKQWEHPYRLDLLRMRCPLGTIAPVRGDRSWRKDGRGACAPATPGRPASARDDKEVI
jgi:hypothetical protein